MVISTRAPGGRPAATGSARQILVGKADGHTGTMGAREHPWCARLGLESTGKALGPQPNAVSTVIGAQWPIPALYKSRPLPCTPGPGGLLAFFLESIFIDQATLNGTRPNSP